MPQAPAHSSFDDKNLPQSAEGAGSSAFQKEMNDAMQKEVDRLSMRFGGAGGLLNAMARGQIGAKFAPSGGQAEDAEPSPNQGLGLADALLAHDSKAFAEALAREQDLAKSPYAEILIAECVTEGDAACLRLLLSHLRAQGQRAVDSQLVFLAIRANQADCLRTLMDFIGFFPVQELLYAAVGSDSLSCAQFALEKASEELVLGKAAISPERSRSARDADGAPALTPLMHAARHSTADIVRLLIPLSDPALQNAAGHTALTIAADSNNKNAPEIIEALLPVSDPNHRLALGSTALMLAAMNNRFESVKALAAASNLRARNTSKDTALALAGKKGHAEIADYLAGMDPTSLSAQTAFEMLGPRKMPQHAAWRERRALMREMVAVHALQQPADATGQGEEDGRQGGEGSGAGRQGRGARRL